jgi:hypothetical protein
MKLIFLFSTDSCINCKPQIGSGVSSGSKLLTTTNARANLNCKISVKIKILQQLLIMFSFLLLLKLSFLGQLSVKAYWAYYQQAVSTGVLAFRDFWFHDMQGS